MRRAIIGAAVGLDLHDPTDARRKTLLLAYQE